MQRRRSRYAPEFRRQMVELVRSGRTPESLGREFEPSAESIRNWVFQADLDEGRREEGGKARPTVRKTEAWTNGASLLMACSYQTRLPVTTIASSKLQTMS